MPEEDNAITYDTFRKFQREEKNNEKLQELPGDFFKSCVNWLNQKEEKFEESRNPNLLHEIENVKKIVRDIFDRRRKKILLLALHSVRSKRVSKNLLPEEEDFFDETVENLRELEKNLLERVLSGEAPGGEEKDEGEVEKTEEGDRKEETTEKAPDTEIKVPEGSKLVRMAEGVEKFMGTDGEEYGPLEEGDIVTLPEDVAELLVEKEKAVESKL